jgi:hypothetical protein
MAFTQGLICLLGLAILPHIDNGLFRNRYFPHTWAQLSIDYVCGVVLFFALFGVVGLLVLMVRACSSACTCCCQCCYDVDDPAYERTNSYTYYGGGDFFFCFYPIPSYHHHHHHHGGMHSGGCSCACLGCGDCNCSGGGGGGGNNDGAAVAVVVIIVILAVIGVIFALIISVLLLTRLYHRHAQITRRYQEAREHRVRDIGGSGVNGVAKSMPTTTTDGDLDQFV